MIELSGRQLAAVLLNEYVEGYSFEVGLKDETVIGKRDTLKRFIHWLGGRPITAETCKAWIMSLKSKGLMPNSLKHEARILRATVRYLYKKKYIKQDFALEIPSPKVPIRPMELPPAEVAEKIIMAGTEPGSGDNCLNRQRKQEYRAALRFILRTGLRNREARSLRGIDINLEDETYLVQSKSGNLDRMPLPKDMLGEIGQRVNNGQLFPSLRRERLNICLKRGCKRLGIKIRVRTHTLRHVFCTTLLKKGVPLQIVSRLMRHASVAITDAVYSHYLVDDLRLSLNSHHPLIKQGLSPVEVFQMVQKAVEVTGVSTDARFKTEIESSSRELLMRLRLV